LFCCRVIWVQHTVHTLTPSLQSRESTRLFLQSSELGPSPPTPSSGEWGPPPPPHQASVYPPSPLRFFGEDMLACGREGGGGVPIRKGDRHWYSRFLCSLCPSLSQSVWLAPRLQYIYIYKISSLPLPPLLEAAVAGSNYHAVKHKGSIWR
jgi:hypothetical protein